MKQSSLFGGAARRAAVSRTEHGEGGFHRFPGVFHGLLRFRLCSVRRILFRVRCISCGGFLFGHLPQCPPGRCCCTGKLYPIGFLKCCTICFVPSLRRKQVDGLSGQRILLHHLGILPHRRVVTLQSLCLGALAFLRRRALLIPHSPTVLPKAPTLGELARSA